MTRINVIPVEDLADQHVMAEYRELLMVNASLRRSLNSKRGFSLDRIPPKYTLNTGHVTFFYDKGLFLFNRYKQLIDELYYRKYEIDPSARKTDWSMFEGIFWNDWTPTKEDKAINAERILIRLLEKPSFYNYNKSKINDEFINNIKEKYIGIPLN